MDVDLTRVPPADLTLLVLGLFVLVGAIGRSTIRGSLASDLHVPWPPRHSLNRFDVVLAAWIYLSLGLIGTIIAQSLLRGDAIATSQPAGEPPLPSVGRLIGGTIGQITAIGILIKIGHDRFEGGVREWGLRVSRPLGELVITVCVTLAALPICYGLLHLTEGAMETVFRMAPQEHPSIKLLRDRTGSEWVVGLTVLNAVVIAPMVEELLFRGLLLPALVKWLRSPVMGLLVSSALFGLIHYQVPKTVPALFVFGAMLGFIYLKQKSLIVVIWVHSLFNLKTVVWLLMGWDG